MPYFLSEFFISFLKEFFVLSLELIAMLLWANAFLNPTMKDIRKRLIQSIPLFLLHFFLGTIITTGVYYCLILFICKFFIFLWIYRKSLTETIFIMFLCFTSVASQNF